MNKFIAVICVSFTIVFFITPVWLSAQSSEQKVVKAVEEINSLMEELHLLAAQKNVTGSIAKLDQINALYKREISWDTFDKEYRNAKMNNSDFDYHLRTDLPPRLDPAFWIDFQQRCNRIMENQDVAVEGFTAMVQLNNFDKMMAYGAQLKTTYETFKNAAENIGTANLPKFAYDLYGNMNDFVENYKKIEEAETAGIDIQTLKIDFNRMMSRARRSKDLYHSYERFIKSNIIAINDFNANVDYVKSLKERASSGPLKPLQPSLDYVWNYEFYENNIKKACDEMEYYEIKCSALKASVDEIKAEARRDWSRVKGNIYASDDEAQKQMYLNDCEDSWKEFNQVSNQIYNQAYELYCIDQSAGNETSENPFDGASTEGTAAVDNYTEPETNTGLPDQSVDPLNSSFIGTISAGGGQGSYAALEVKYFENNDRIVFVRKSGTLKFVQLIWRKQGGIWETAYEGSQTSFRFGDLKAKMPAGTTHLNFVVNAHHNRWSQNDVSCVMDVFLVHGNSAGSGSSSASAANNNTSRQDQAASSSSQNMQPDNTYRPPPQASKVNTPNKEFADLINKANESFNKPYWEEERGTRASSNPKQESLNYLVKASRLINSEPDVKNQYDMMYILVSTSSQFAKRVNAFEFKIPFINLAGRTASNAGNQISAIQDENQNKKEELKKYAHTKLADAWKSIRDATLVHGGSQYSLEYCDKEYVKYKSLSER